jgi:S-formylglutathione hydrolase FrmB
MGGYGALVLGLRHPDLFCFVGSMSGSPDVPLGIPDLERNGRGGMRASVEHAFGADTSSWAGFAPERIVRTIDTASAPYLYLANGIQDEFAARLLFYRSFADIARGRGMRYEYHETPGRHSWEYWTREIDPLLRRFSELTSLR